ncbi:MAG TPA: DUF2341 domain-containing protein, partial [Candidatus Methylomirabilis sp.]|nr:DUF2341 domain-containing protein [Candidatus Methylomirabilis sp.]
MSKKIGKHKISLIIFAGLAVLALIFSCYSWWARASHPNTPPAATLAQYNSDTTVSRPNGSFFNTKTMNFSATTTDPTDFFPALYFQLASTSGSFLTSTTTPASPCKSGLDYASCSSKVWVNATSTDLGWYNAKFPYRNVITVQSSKITGALTNFPVYLNLKNLGSGNSFWGHTKKNSDGGDIVMTDTVGNRLPVEVVSVSTSSKTGEIYFKSSAISSSSNITFYMYYGSSTASQPASSTTYGARNVWYSNYAAVWHMGQAQGVPIKDSTSNGNLSTLSSAPTATTGCKLGNCLTFNGTSNYITVANSASLLSPKTQLTLSAWFNTTSGGGGQKIVGKVDSGVSRGYV